MKSLKEKWEIRAKKNLLNEGNLSEENLDYALKEAQEIVNGKEVGDYALLDIALIRLKILLKIELNGEDELLYKQALNEVKNAPKIGSKTRTHYKSQIRRSEFDLQDFQCIREEI